MAGRSKSKRSPSRRGRGAAHEQKNAGAGPAGDEAAESRLRIIGGRLRGKKLLRPDRTGTRPMKERVREAVFNLLGPRVRDTVAVDLFAGAGALGLEAISRGARCAIFIEQHFPTANLIRDNARLLGVENQVDIRSGDAFYWQPRLELPGEVAVFFCSPPYQLYVDRKDDMRRMLAELPQQCGPDSVLLVEFDERFLAEDLPEPELWETRHYAPAFVARRIIASQ